MNHSPGSPSEGSKRWPQILLMLEQHYVSFSWKDLEDEFAIQFDKIVELNKGDERKNKDSLKLQHLKLRLFFDPSKLPGRYKQSQITVILIQVLI